MLQSVCLNRSMKQPEAVQCMHQRFNSEPRNVIDGNDQDARNYESLTLVHEGLPLIIIAISGLLVRR